jgi:hypothetical protein
MHEGFVINLVTSSSNSVGLLLRRTLVRLEWLLSLQA